MKKWVQNVVKALEQGIDLVYLALAILFFLTAIWILVMSVATMSFGNLNLLISQALNEFLIVLMIIEILHTIFLFLKTHTFRHEPFLVVGIIAGIRRILVITATHTVRRASFNDYLLELVVTTFMVFLFAVALWLSKRDQSHN